MPILLPEDMKFPLPRMYKVRQSFPRKQIADIPAAIRAEMNKEEIKSEIAPGAKAAVAVGSRGIKNLSAIVKTTLECIQEAGGKPFIIAAMGSHGGGTDLGRKEILDGYGITESAMGVPVVTDGSTNLIGITKSGTNVFFSQVAKDADLIVPINRIKLHTDFNFRIQSGLCKMIVVGLGGHPGCTAIHEVGYDFFGQTILEACDITFKKTNIPFGIGLIENAYDETAFIEAIPRDKIISREEELLKIACENMPRLAVPEIDVLVVKEIGKNISGAGFDPNILGKSLYRTEFPLPVPRIDRMVLLDITEQSQGNASGLGTFDIITKQVFDKIDLEKTYANAIAARVIEDAKIPLTAPDADAALRIAIKMLRGADKENLKIVKIKNTLELEEIEVSEAVYKEGLY